MKKNLLLTGLLVGSAFLTHGQDEKLDLTTIQKIRQEGMERSQVMQTAFYLTDVNGPRLQGPGFMKAANWAKGKLTSWGMPTARLESWGDWGKGWAVEHAYLAMTAPYYKTIIAVPRAWSGSTNKLQTADILYISNTDTTALESYRSKLKNKVILIDQSYPITPSFKADANRYTDEALQKMANESVSSSSRSGPDTTYRSRILAMRTQNAFNQKMRKLAKQEGAVGILNTTQNSVDGTLFVSGDYANAALGATPDDLADLSIAVEDYLTLCRLMKAGVPVKLEVDVRTKFYTDDIKGYNVLAEIPGTDPKLKDEVVMLGAHLDSWHAATGATDNAAGSSVMLEAMRILKTVGASPRRTIRIALWSGEEQGLHGSKNYVAKHLVDANNKLTKEGENIAAYFNVDNGTGKIRGVYLQENLAAGPIFSQWLKPFNDLGATTVTPRNTGGTDHLFFDRAGLPGFQFIQDPIEYSTRTHHTNMDTYDHLIEDDLKQAATVVAGFVYNAAMRDQKLPRKSPAAQAAR